MYCVFFMVENINVILDVGHSYHTEARGAALAAVAVRGAINSCICMPLRLAIISTRTRCVASATRYLEFHIEARGAALEPVALGSVLIPLRPAII
jgi:hypothetical protein